MDIVASTRAYEAWKRSLIPLRAADLKLKHAAMRSGMFPFLRATFYRWLEVWPQVCPELTAAPRVLAVGDLHIENFGTWRDAEGRLVWGVNDVDEAAVLPYTLDLVRLAASARLAIGEGSLALGARAASAAILAGYASGLERGRPLVLAGEHAALRAMAVYRLKDPAPYWVRLAALPRCAPAPVPIPWPQPRLKLRHLRRTAGLGSLGHRRVVALAEWRGGWIAREAKQLAPSAAVWLKAGHEGPRGAEILLRAVRCPDPFVTFDRGWLVRRLAPDCSRIELTSLPRVRDERRLLRAMGFEAANLHGGAGAPPAVAKDLRRRPEAWLHVAAKAMAAQLQVDFIDWRDA